MNGQRKLQYDEGRSIADSKGSGKREEATIAVIGLLLKAVVGVVTFISEIFLGAAQL